MTIIKSTEAQKSFGQTIDQAHGDEVVVVERYGRPRVVIVDYERYRQLIDGERERMRSRLAAASAAASGRAAGLTDGEVDRMIEEARTEAHAGQSAA